MSPRAMIVLIFTVLSLISSSVHGSLQITDQEYPLMHYTKLISEEYFIVGRPIVIVLPLAEEESTNKGVGYLLEELHRSVRWPILVYNVGYKLNRNMYTEIYQHGSYIILTSELCTDWKITNSNFFKQLNVLMFDNNTRNSWNPRAKFVVSVMSNCTHFDNTLISKPVLEHLWNVEVMNATVLFLMSSEHGGNDLQQNTTDSAQGPYVELHTWKNYENSDRCILARGIVRVKVFTVRNLSDFRRSEIFTGYFDKNSHGCTINVDVRTWPLLVYTTRHIWHNDSKYQYYFVEEWGVELVKVIGEALNFSLHILNTVDGKVKEFPIDAPSILVGVSPPVDSKYDHLYEYTHSYLSLRIVWYTPCAVKYQRWSRFFNIFSVDMWICFAFSLVLAVITVRCISNYAHKSHLHESNSYSNIFSVTANIIAVSLSVSVNTQPRSAPLRLFFFCWVCYSVAISTVFQAYLTTFLIEPGYEEPIKSVEQMLKSEKMFGISKWYNVFFTKISDPVDSAIIKDAVKCTDESTCFTWAAVYHNISAPIKDLDVDIYRARGEWTDKNSRPLLCEIDGGVVRTIRFAIMYKKGIPFFEFMDDVLSHIIEGGIFMHIKKRSFDKLKIESKLDVPTFDDTYYDINIIHLQTAFYFLMLGYVLAGVCFVTEIMWHRYRSKRRGPTGTSIVCHGQT